MKVIKYYSMKVYGSSNLYLADPKEALLWERATGRVTIGDKQMAIMGELFGVKFERVFEPVSV